MKRNSIAGGSRRLAESERVRIKRAYATPSESDGLRRWFGHDPGRWPDFARRYRAELRAQAASAILDTLATRARGAPITLVYGARDEAHNNAVVLRDEIARRLGAEARG